MAKGRIKPNFWQIFAAANYGPNDGTPILWSQGKEEGVYSKAQELANQRGEKVHIFEVYKCPPMSKALDRYELFETVHPAQNTARKEAAAQDRRDIELAKALLRRVSIDDKATMITPLELGRIFRIAAADLAERAIWAAYQDETVVINDDRNFEDIQDSVKRAVDIGFLSKNNDEAIDLAMSTK